VNCQNPYDLFAISHLHFSQKADCVFVLPWDVTLLVGWWVHKWSILVSYLIQFYHFSTLRYHTIVSFPNIYFWYPHSPQVTSLHNLILSLVHKHLQKAIWLYIFIGSKSLWWWLISTLIALLDIIHRPVSLKTAFRRLDSVSVLR
jgi:hypothetical protein